MDLEAAVAKQLANIEVRSGKSLDELRAIILKSGLQKHGEIRDMLKRDLGMGHGDANTLVHTVLQSAAASTARSSKLTPQLQAEAFYVGPKAALLPVHRELIRRIEDFGPFEWALKKNYVSLRRKKQFAMIGPATQTRVELGLNVKDLPESNRLLIQPPKSMCSYVVRLTDAGQVDNELSSWIRKAYDNVG